MDESGSALTVVLLGRPQQLAYEELEPAVSGHTGRTLRCVAASFTVPAAESEEVAKAIDAARDPSGALGDENGELRWIVTSNSSSYRDGSPTHGHRVELRELELVQAERLEFLGVSVEPRSYREELDSDGMLIVEAIVAPDRDADERIEQAISERDKVGYFELVRMGVSDNPIRVRFGRCLWQRGENGGRLHLLRLVADEGAEPQSDLWLLDHQPEKGRVARIALQANEGVEALIEGLGAAGVLDEEAIARVRGRMEAAPEARVRELDEAKQLDLHFDPQ